jgi:hypothetical protein
VRENRGFGIRRYEVEVLEQGLWERALPAKGRVCRPAGFQSGLEDGLTYFRSLCRAIGVVRGDDLL